jgi:hypothetical protein
MHTHVFGQNDQEIAEWIKAVDARGIEKAIVLTGATGIDMSFGEKMYRITFRIFETADEHFY